MSYQEMIDGYNDLREVCLMIAKNNPELFHDGARFKMAIVDSDVTLDYSSDGIHGHGSAYTTQTMSQEYFSFIIPFEVLEEK
jgi:hypothetical protein